MKNAVSDALVITRRQLLLLVRVPEVLIFSTIQPVMFVLLFRYVFGGSFAEWNPISTMVTACRQLFGLVNHFGVTADSYPSQHPLTMSIFYMLLIMLIFIPLSVRKYNNASKK